MQWWNGSDEPIADGAVWAALGSELPVGGGSASQPGETGKARITPLIPAMSLPVVAVGSFCSFKNINKNSVLSMICRYRLFAFVDVFSW